MQRESGRIVIGLTRFCNNDYYETGRELIESRRKHQKPDIDV